MYTRLANHEVAKIIPNSSYGEDYIDWGLKAIYAEEAWKKTKGKGIKVAVLDTGIDSDHPDLKDNIVEAVDFTGSKYGSEDKQGHGTHCAGIIAAIDNGIGMIGVAPEASIYSAKVLGDIGSGSYESIIRGIEWAIEKEVDIISMSLGTPATSRVPRSLHKTVKKATEQGIIIIAATGNENQEVCYPAAYDEVIAVSAVDQNLNKANFSNHGIHNEITAPGVEITSTYRNGQYAKLSGTSMATPMIAGATALLISRYKELFFGLKPSVEKAHQILEKMTKDLGEKGKDELYGAGIIDLRKLP